MGLAVIIGLALALACALATNVAFLFKHRGAVLAPPVRVRHPLRSAADLFRSKWFAVGWVVAVGAWGLHVGALALAPLSIVQAVLSGGLVFLAVLAERYFGFHLGRRQWIGLIITAAGLVVIGLTSGSHAGEPPGYALAALIAVECTVLVLATGLTAFSSRLGVGPAAEGMLLGAAAGALFGVSDIALKYLTDAVQDGVLELDQPVDVRGAGGLGVRLLCLGRAACSSARASRSSRSPRSRPTSSRSSAAFWSSATRSGRGRSRSPGGWPPFAWSSWALR